MSRGNVYRILANNLADEEEIKEHAAQLGQLEQDASEKVLGKAKPTKLDTNKLSTQLDKVFKK